MTRNSHSQTIKIPLGDRSVFSIRDKLIGKAEVRLTAAVETGQQESSRPNPTEVQLSQHIRGSISASVDSDALGGVLDKIVADGECRASHFTPIVSGLAANLGVGNATLSLGWDSDLCFLTAEGTTTLSHAGLSLAGRGKYQFGFHESVWFRLIKKIWDRAPGTRRFIIRIQALFSNLFGSSLVRHATALRGMLAGIRRLVPYMWAIDIALLLQDLTLMETRRQYREGREDGNLVTFANTFTRNIFGHRRRRSHADSRGDVQRLADTYSQSYQGQQRISVQRHLNLFYGNGTTVRTYEHANRVGVSFGINGLGSIARNVAGRRGHRRDSSVERRIDHYFQRRMEPWINNWHGTTQTSR